MSNPRLNIQSAEETGLAAAIDHLLDTGVVVAGDLVLSVAGVDLVYCSLRVLLMSADRYYDMLEEMRQNRAEHLGKEAYG